MKAFNETEKKAVEIKRDLDDAKIRAEKIAQDFKEWAEMVQRMRKKERRRMGR
jgi:hypothetical protein